MVFFLYIVDYKYGHLPNPLVNVLIPNVNPTEYISTITPNPTYILSNFSFLLKLLIAIHDQSSFGSDFICSEFNDRPLISKRIYEIYQDLLYHLNATLQKEVHLNQRGLMNLTALGDFLESLVIGPDTQAELLKLLLTPILNLPHRHLSSSRCTHPDLEETCYKKLTLSKFTFLFTEPIHISFGLRLCLIWLEAFPNISSTTYWHQVPILIQLACGETRTIQTMYTLLCFLEIQRSKFDASSLMKFWTLLGETVLQTYSTLKTPTSEFDPFVEHTDTLAYSIYCWPFCVSLTSPDLELPATLLFTYLDHLIPTSLTMLIQFFLDHFPPSLTLSTSTLATLISSVTTLLQHQFHPDLVSRCVSWIPSSLLSESILPSFLITFIETLPKLVTDPSKTTAPWFSCLNDHWKTLFSYKHLHPCLQTTWEIMCAKEPPPSPLPDIQEKNEIDVPHEQEDRLKRKGNETEEALEIHSDIQSPLKKRKFKVHTTPLNDMHQEDRLEFLRDSKLMKDMSVRELLHYQNQLHTLLLEVNATLSEKVLELDPSLRPCIPSTTPSDT
ncbi:hypothetical protein HMI55_002037 [Coelomomyces lativittatus]|nr:hypothetical protein HMI55_002037 [Coelomomyces lativittatus]